MARLDSEDVKLVKPAKPPRGFPFRLLLYAVLMTGAAGAAGYYAWTLREQGKSRETVIAACAPARDKAVAEAAACTKDLTTANATITTVSEKAKQAEDQVARIGKDLSGTKEELTALRTQRAELEKRMAAIADIQAQFAKMIDTGQLQVSARRGNLVVALPAEVLFPSGSAQLSKDGELKVLEVGFILKRLADRRFLVVGHTDNVPLKGAANQDNWQLSTDRALTVTRVLVQAGMKPDSLIAAGAGENDPVVKNDSTQNRARNRRIEIQLMPQVSELPPLPASLEQEPAPAGGAAPAPAAPPT
jgi:chemotaxis protein MotB